MTDETAKVAQPVPDKVMLIHFSQAQAILNYLAKQPCGEVYQFATWLMELKEAPIVALPVLNVPATEENDVLMKPES